MKNQNTYKRVYRAKYNKKQYNISTWKINDHTKDKNESIFADNIFMKHTTISENDLTENTEPGEEAYDYEKFKKEYEEQIVENINYNKTYNDTEEGRGQPKEEITELFNFQNCTKVSKKVGIKAIDCLINNYEHEKNKPIVKKTVSKIWLIIKVWSLIYICLAIPCWCQKGWCCCCFRCNVCFPRKRINFAKRYYGINPPGILNKQVKKQEKEQLITYEPTEFEEDAYKTLEVVIRNI